MTTRIDLIPNPDYCKSGTKSYLHAMRKYRFSPTKEGPYFLGSVMQQAGRQYTDKPVGGRARFRQILQKRLPDGNIGEVGADDLQQGHMYTAPVPIGTPKQTLKLDFDTGSADLWVWSTELTASVLSQRKSLTVFDPSKSSTFQRKPSTWRILFADLSSAAGTIGADVVHLGDIALKDQAIELASSISGSITRSEADGVLGLAFDSANTVRPLTIHTPVESIAKKDDISAPLFTVKLHSYRDKSEECFYTFGVIDEPTVKATGQELHYVRVDNRKGLWMFDSLTASVNGKITNRPANVAVADTGTMLTLVDDQTCDAIYKAVPGAAYSPDYQGYIYPADTEIDELPFIQLGLGEKLFTVPKEHLAFSPASEGHIYGGIQSRGSLDFDVLGDTFLKGIYAVFDIGNLRFGAVQR